MGTTDVLKVDRILVDDRIYRLLPIRESLKLNDEDGSSKTIHYSYDEDDVDPDVPITHQGDRFISTIFVPADFIGLIVGASYKNIKALSSQYNVKISIPDKKNIEAGIIFCFTEKNGKLFFLPYTYIPDNAIQGSTKRDVCQTYQRIADKILNARMKTDFTHFISFPVNSSNIQESFLKFKDEILKKYKGVRGIDHSIFQKPAKLHVTAAILVLLDERDKQNSVALLNKCTDSFLKELGDNEIVVQVKGLEIMNDDPSEVDVLYAKMHELDDDNRLQILADKIVSEFVAATLSRTQHEGVKLHVTLMNTIFRDHLENKDDAERITFDASRIMKELGDFDFGQIVISEIHISIRYTEALDGYYNCIHKMKLKS